MENSQFPGARPPWEGPVPAPARGPNLRFLQVLAVLGLAGLGVGTLAALKPDGQQNADGILSATLSSGADSGDVAAAIERVCNAYLIASAAVNYANNPADPGDDGALRKANIAMAQLSHVAGAVYLQNQIDPALEPEMVDAVHVLIEKWMLVAVEAVGGGSNTFGT